MDPNPFFDVRFAAFCGMLFSATVAITAEEPQSVPAVFQALWRRYRLFRETRRIRSSRRPVERFWEIDMTKFEP